MARIINSKPVLIFQVTKQPLLEGEGKSELKFESTFWSDVEKLAEQYVSSKNYNIIKDASVLAFIGRPSEYRMLDNVLKKYREDNSRQFVLTYKIFTIDKKKSVNWELLQI